MTLPDFLALAPGTRVRWTHPQFNVTRLGTVLDVGLRSARIAWDGGVGIAIVPTVEAEARTFEVVGRI